MSRSLLSIVAFLPIAAIAQQFCGTTAPAERYVPPPIDTPQRGGGGTILIPTVVHVHYGGLILPLGPLHVQAMIEACNLELRAQNPEITGVIPEFAGVIGDLQVELQLATRDEDGNCMSGIRYHLFDPEVEMPNTLAPTQNTRSYLNIHIGPWPQSFATFPQPVSSPYDPTDVIMLTGPYNSLVNTLSHEVGHWLGLYHVWGTTNTTGTCGDDYIADTPITAGSPLDCVLDRAECTPGVIENVQNHMDYSSCRIMFTQGQANRAQAVLADTTRVRHSVIVPENLVSTGIIGPAICPITADMHYRVSSSCTGTTISYHAMAEHAQADSVHWTFSGATPPSATGDHVQASYSTSGTYSVQLIVFGGGGSATVNTSLYVDVPSGNDNGLATVSMLPFTEGFENGFSLPQPHLMAVDHGEPGWQPFSNAGFASTASVYVPAGNASIADTSDLVIGNFDLSALQQPAIRFKVATTYQTFTSWSTLQILFRDQCSNIFIGNIWHIQQLNELATDQGAGFIPTSDDQWTTVQATFPEWNLATSAEFIIRLIRVGQGASYTPEAFFLDDINVGELPVITGVADMQDAPAISIFPNPATDRLQIQRSDGLPIGMIEIWDAQGRSLRSWHGPHPYFNAPVGDLPRGLYLVRAANAAMRIVLE